MTAEQRRELGNIDCCFYVVELDYTKTLHAPVGGESSTQAHKTHHRNARCMDIITVLHFAHQAVEATVCSKAIERSADEKQHKERRAKTCHLPASLAMCLA